MPHLLDKFIVFLLFSSIQLMVVGGLVGLFVTLFRVRGRAAYWMFGFVILVPLLSPVHNLYPEQLRIELQEDSRIYGGLVAFVSLGVPSEPTDVELARSSSTAVEANESATEESRNSSTGSLGGLFLIPFFYFLLFVLMYWKVLVGIAWSLVVIALSVRLARTLHGFWNMLRASTIPKNPEIKELLERCANEVGLRRPPRLAIADQADIPMVAGLFRPLIVIPSRLAEPENEDKLRYALLHEMVHIRRRDGWWLLLETIVSIVYFFHPIVRWAIRRLREERELLSDRGVVSITGNANAYSDFLATEIWDVETDEWKAFALPFNPGSPTAAHRVKRLLKYPWSSDAVKIRDCFAFGIAAGVLMLVLAFAPQEQEDWESLDFSRAIATEQPNVYYVPVVFEELRWINGTNIATSQTRLREDEDYTFDKKTGLLSLNIKLGEKEELIAFGRRKVPWAWRCEENIDPDSVRVVIGDRLCIPNIDYWVEPDKSQIRIVERKLCDARQSWFVKYDLKPQDQSPTTASTITLGPHTPPIWAAPRGHDRDQHDGRGRAAFGQVSLTALPTEDPSRFRLPNNMRLHHEEVSIRTLDRVSSAPWPLIEGEEYEYDEEQGTITLKGLRLEETSQVLFVEGQWLHRGFFGSQRKRST